MSHLYVLPLTAGRDWGWDPNLRQAPGDYPIDDTESDITALMWNGVGGGTVVFAAQWQRNMPSDFRVRSLDGVADDWPFTYEDLEPYYVRVEKDFGISGLAGDTAFPPGEGPPLPPVPPPLAPAAPVSPGWPGREPTFRRWASASCGGPAPSARRLCVCPVAATGAVARRASRRDVDRRLRAMPQPPAVHVRRRRVRSADRLQLR